MGSYYSMSIESQLCKMIILEIYEILCLYVQRVHLMLCVYASKIILNAYLAILW